MTIDIDQSFDTIIGVLPKERVAKQEVRVETKIIYTYKKGCFIDYAVVANMIKETTIENEFELIEDALISLQDKISKSYSQILQLHMKISKPNILTDAIVSVSI